MFGSTVLVHVGFSLFRNGLGLAAKKVCEGTFNILLNICAHLHCDFVLSPLASHHSSSHLTAFEPFLQIPICLDSVPRHILKLFRRIPETSASPELATTPPNMDIGLEFCDTFIFDHLYAALLPLQPTPYNLKDGYSNSSMIDIRAASPWVHHPTTQFLNFRPRDAAYMSQWTRDNYYRQCMSLFLITWLVDLAGSLLNLC